MIWTKLGLIFADGLSRPQARETVYPVKLPPSSSDYFDEPLHPNGENWLQSPTHDFSPPSSSPSGREMNYDSGHFRPKLATIWDPHPEYIFTAFNHLFRLVLSPADDFLSPTLRVTTHERNFTWRDDVQTATVGNRCFYRGVVAGDMDSSVAVSLCHGMVRKLCKSMYIEADLKLTPTHHVSPVFSQIINDLWNSEDQDTEIWLEDVREGVV